MSRYETEEGGEIEVYEGDPDPDVPREKHQRQDDAEGEDDGS